MKNTMILLCIALVLCSCKKETEPVVADNAAKQKLKSKVAPIKKAVAKKAQQKSIAECVAKKGVTPERKFKVAGKEWEQKGTTLSLLTADADDELIVGHLTDIKDYTPENAANLDVIMKWFKKNNVDVVAITGDLGENLESIQKVVEHVAKHEVLTLAIIGNRECRNDFNNALAAAQKNFAHVVNLNKVRVVNTDDASFVSLPGYYNPSYIHCAEGCVYYPEDAQALSEWAKEAKEPRVIVSHGPPKQSGANALDRIHEELNVGDPALTKAMEGGLFAFGLFGNIQEAGGYATDLSGRQRIAPKAFASALYLNSGPVDSVPWEMLDGTDSQGMAGILKIKGKQASHDIYRIKPGEAKVTP